MFSFLAQPFQAPKNCSGGSGSSYCANCKTKQVECKFPFTYKGKTYNGCTDADTSNGRRWCATKVGDDGRILQDSNNETYFWGTCDMAKCHEHCEQFEDDKLKKAEVALQDGSIIFMQEWKNQCQMNFTGELKGLDPNMSYSLSITNATISNSSCPDPSDLATRLTRVTTDANGTAIINETHTRSARLFGDASAIGKTVVLSRGVRLTVMIPIR